VIGILALLLAGPPLLPTFWIWVLVEVLAFALFAASRHLLMGTGGMVSFGHAAAFGTGAYGAALLLQGLRAPTVVVRALADNIAALKREGLTILVSEQNVKFARRLADHAYIIEKGQIKFEGSIAALDANEPVRRAYLSV
jgi:ABC-type branched-subunit amino acid transport system permease subunit